ncbi:hypothetical protein [Falsiroseomonas sp. E2-1-a20]|uniref:hypothetical protein n=1 Tax=Falsiroseomonas sp. E2-1-a20 TaxID=3239300 RepID=UPI003F2AA103
MASQNIDPATLTPKDMGRLRAELQQQYRMTPAQAVETADLLAHMEDRLPAMETAMSRILADLADIRATLHRIEARMATTADGSRGPSV